MGSQIEKCFNESEANQTVPIVQNKRRRQLRQLSRNSSLSISTQIADNGQHPKPPTPPQITEIPESSVSEEELISTLVNQVIERQNEFTKKKLSLKDFEKINMLGEGGFAVVYRVRRKYAENEKASDEIFAMKVISKKQLYERCIISSVMFQRWLMIKLNCNFAVKLFCSFQDKHSCYFIMEYAKGGDVYSFLINKKQPLKAEAYAKTGEAGAKFILACVILAFERLHEENVVYRDLKPENVLVFDNGYAKLADFGLAKINKPGDIESVEAGTKIYFAPEVVQEAVYQISGIDFWTLGIFLHELIYRRPPFNSGLIQRGKFRIVCEQWEKDPKWPHGTTKITPEAKDLIKKFLRVQPQSRLGFKRFADIKEHPFFTGFEWQQLLQQQMISPLQSIVEQFPQQAFNGVNKRHPAFNEESLPGVEGFTFTNSFAHKQ